MESDNSPLIFENSSVRRVFDETDEKWYFSVIDVVAILSASVNPCDYWFKMKTRVQNEDGKKYTIDCADVHGLLRIIQSRIRNFNQYHSSGMEWSVR